MRTENFSGSLSQSPLCFDPIPNQTQSSFWDRISDGRLPPRDIALPRVRSGTNDEQSAPAYRRSARWRRDLLIEDMTDLLGRALIYALATLGLLNALGLVAAA
jgi:hypothetical protein